MSDQIEELNRLVKQFDIVREYVLAHRIADAESILGKIALAGVDVALTIRQGVDNQDEMR